MHFHYSDCVFALFCSQKMRKHIFYSWNSVPNQDLQIISDWVIFIFIGNNIYSRFDHTLTCYFIMLFQIHFQIVFVCICNRRTVISPLPWHLFYNVHSSGKLISFNRFFQYRIILKYRYAVSDCLLCSSFIGMLQHIIDIFYCKHFLVHNIF